MILYYLWYLVVPLVLAFYWGKDSYLARKNKKIITAWFDPPKDKYNFPFKPEEVALLVNKKSNSRLVVATIINLAYLKYFNILNDGDSVIFDRSGCTGNLELLTPYELAIYKGLFTNDRVVLSNWKKHKKNFFNLYKRFTRLVDDRLFNEGLLINKPDKIYYVILFLFAGLLTANILLLIVTYIFQDTNEYTPKGMEKLSEALSLKNFLLSQKDQYDFQLKNKTYVEKLLPYAVALGIEKKWLNQYKGLLSEIDSNVNKIIDINVL